MKNFQYSIGGILVMATTISLLLISNTIGAYGQINSSNTTTTPLSNQSTTSNNPNQMVINSIDKAITAIKDGNNDEAKKSFFQAESGLEGKKDLINTEKRIEASLKALKDGDSNSAIMHAEEAKKNLY